MAKPRELRRRIRSVENTRKITRTMEMVATSKMKRAQDRVIAARPYAHALADVIAGLYSPDLADRFPLLRQPAGKARRAAVIVMTGNRGLAGAFNSNVIKEARNLLARLADEGTDVQVHAVGKKGLGYFRYVGRAVASSRTDIGDAPASARSTTSGSRTAMSPSMSPARAAAKKASTRRRCFAASVAPSGTCPSRTRRRARLAS